jgi:N-acetyl-1-D-myo-inositol-2-amino-2-deoxy-alpha-D-glucopyranoside deacetylase
MAVHAHPDDETITMGGTLALLSERGAQTAVVCCTDGKLATIVDPDMPEETTRPRLAEIREGELRAACDRLGVTEVVFLRYGDSGMAGADTNRLPDAFWTQPLDAVVGRLVQEIRRFRPHVIATYDANGGYGHPDHIQTHRATVLAAEAADSPLYKEGGPRWRVSKVYYSVFPVSWMRRIVDAAKRMGMDPPFGEENPESMEMLTPDELVSAKIDTSSVIGPFRDALRAHRSQIGPDWPQLAIPEEIAKEFAVEHFSLALSRVPVTRVETDLFAGLSGD